MADWHANEDNNGMLGEAGAGLDFSDALDHEPGAWLRGAGGHGFGDLADHDAPIPQAPPPLPLLVTQPGAAEAQPAGAEAQPPPVDAAGGDGLGDLVPDHDAPIPQPPPPLPLPEAQPGAAEAQPAGAEAQPVGAAPPTDAAGGPTAVAGEHQAAPPPPGPTFALVVRLEERAAQLKELLTAVHGRCFETANGQLRQRHERFYVAQTAEGAMQPQVDDGGGRFVLATVGTLFFVDNGMTSFRLDCRQRNDVDALLFVAKPVQAIEQVCVLNGDENAAHDGPACTAAHHPCSLIQLHYPNVDASASAALSKADGPGLDAELLWSADGSRKTATGEQATQLVDSLAALWHQRDQHVASIAVFKIRRQDAPRADTVLKLKLKVGEESQLFAQIPIRFTRTKSNTIPSNLRALRGTRKDTAEDMFAKTW